MRYSHGHHSSVLASHGTRTAANSCGYLLPRLESGMSVLDVGCGPGPITLDLAEVVGPGLVVGVENVEAPLTAAREAAAARGDQATRFQLADALKLPFEDNSFDVVHAHQVLQHLIDPVGALKEMARVCRPSGTVAVRDVDYEQMTWFPVSDALLQWRDTYRTIARANGAEPDAGRRLRAWANAADLSDVITSTSTWTYATPENTRWWGDSQAARVTDSAFARQALEQGLDRADLEAIAQAWRSWGEHPDAYFVMVHGEILATPSVNEEDRT